MRKIRALITAVIFVALSSSVFAEEAVVTFVSGKVEVQRSGKWIALQKGDTVQKSETISTGFQSEVKIKVMDSVMYLGPVTRITLEELSSNGKQDNVNVYLKTGTARSQVKHTDNKRVNYQVHTAVAVASCRGTDWTIDDSNNVYCYEGTVAVAAYDIDNPPVMDTGDELEDEEESEEKSDEEAKEGEAAGEAEKSEKTDENEAGGEKAEASDSVNTGSEKTDTAKSDTGKSSGSKKSDAPKSSDGVLVKANQTVKVSETNDVSAPVNTAEKKADEISSAVSTASDKEAVVAASVPKSASGKRENEKGGDTSVRKETGTIIVNIQIP